MFTGKKTPDIPRASPPLLGHMGRWMASQHCGWSALCRARQYRGVKSPPGRNLLFFPSILMLGIITTFPGQVMVLWHLGYP